MLWSRNGCKMKKRTMLITLLFVIIHISGMKTTCIAESITGADLTHGVGQSIEGRYVVSFGYESTMIGYLYLDSGQYTYTSLADAETEAAGCRFFFVRYPDGTYRTEYYGSVRPESVLEMLEDNAILLTVALDAVEAGTSASDPPCTDRTFLIRSDRENAGLYFHSTVSELELWTVEKQWDDLP
jgi:hypothetical protein